VLEQADGCGGQHKHGYMDSTSKLMAMVHTVHGQHKQADGWTAQAWLHGQHKQADGCGLHGALLKQGV